MASARFEIGRHPDAVAACDFATRPVTDLLAIAV